MFLLSPFPNCLGMLLQTLLQHSFPLFLITKTHFRFYVLRTPGSFTHNIARFFFSVRRRWNQFNLVFSGSGCATPAIRKRTTDVYCWLSLSVRSEGGAVTGAASVVGGGGGGGGGGGAHRHIHLHRIHKGKTAVNGHAHPSTLNIQEWLLLKRTRS